MTATPLNRILFVEDDPDIQIVARLALQTVGGFIVEICSSGREALDAAPTCQPDLVLLDMMMPEMDGLSTLKALRNLPQTIETPVIFLTAKVQTHEVANYKEAGAIDVISKPFDPMTLAATLNRLWTQYYG